MTQSISLVESEFPFTGKSLSYKYGTVAEVTLSYVSTVPSSMRPKVESSQRAVDILRPLYGESLEHRESFHVLALDRGNRALAHYKVSEGGIAGTTCDPKIIFQFLLRVNAAGCILSHNHPSGNLKTSQSDIDITKRLKQLGTLMEIQVLDHVILTKESHFSFADEGIL